MTNELPEQHEDIIIVPANIVRPFFEEKWEKSADEGIESVYKTRNPGVDFLVTELKQNIPNAKVLDLGCGDGRFSLQYALNGFQVDALDFSEKALERVRHRAQLLKVSDKVHTLPGDIKNLHIMPSSYNAIAASNVLHYFNEAELKQIINRMKTGTDKKGYNLISFESDIIMSLPKSRRKFKFSNQPNWEASQIRNFLTDQYADWNIINVFTQENSIYPYLPLNVRQVLNTNEENYERKFKVIEIIAQNIK